MRMSDERLSHSLDSKESNGLEVYLDHIFEKECKYTADKNEVKFIQTGVEKFLLACIERGSESIQEGFFSYPECGVNCDIKYFKPELLKVGSFYEKTRNKFPDEFDYIIVVGTVENLPIEPQLRKINIDVPFKYTSDQDASTFIEFDTNIGNTVHGPAETVSLCYSKSGKKHIISVDISYAVRYIYTRDIHEIKDIIKEDSVFHPEFREEILKTGSFLLMDHVVHKQFGAEHIGPFRVSVTETELRFMKCILSRKHRKVYRLLKYLINGKFSDNVLKYISTGNSLSISSYNIKTALFCHHYQCQNESKPSSDCVLDILNYFFNKTNPDQQTNVEVFADSLCTFEITRTAPGTYADFPQILHRTKRLHTNPMICGSDEFPKTVIQLFYCFIERMKTLRKSSSFKKCSHTFNDSLLEMLLQTPLVFELAKKKWSERKVFNQCDERQLSEIIKAGRIQNCATTSKAIRKSFD